MSGGGAAEVALTRSGGAQTKMTRSDIHHKGPAGKEDALIRFMVMTKQSFSASPEDAQLPEEVRNNFERRPCLYHRGVRERLSSKGVRGCGHCRLLVVDCEGGHTPPDSEVL